MTIIKSFLVFMLSTMLFLSCTEKDENPQQNPDQTPPTEDGKAGEGGKTTEGGQTPGTSPSATNEAEGEELPTYTFSWNINWNEKSGAFLEFATSSSFLTVSAKNPASCVSIKSSEFSTLSITYSEEGLKASCTNNKQTINPRIRKTPEKPKCYQNQILGNKILEIKTSQFFNQLKNTKITVTDTKDKASAGVSSCVPLKKKGNTAAPAAS